MVYTDATWDIRLRSFFSPAVRLPGDTEQVVNPAWRDLKRSCHALTNKLRYRNAAFAALTLHPRSEEEKGRYEQWLRKKTTPREEIVQYEHQLAEEKARLKSADKRISWERLEEKDQFHRLLPGRKRLMDTVRMIDYRAETAMAPLLVSATVDFAVRERCCRTSFVPKPTSFPMPRKRFFWFASTVRHDRRRIARWSNSSPN